MTWHPRDLPRFGGSVRLELGAIAEVVLDHQEARQAITPGMMIDLEDVVRLLEVAESTVAVVLRGADERAFCAGGDLRAVEAHLLDDGDGMCGFMTDLLDRLGRLPMLVVAAVEGAALGGGAELLSVCDRVVASDRARIGWVQAKLGVSPGWGGAGRLVRRIGPRSAATVLARAEVLDSSEALAIGLVDEVVAAGTAVAAARAWLEPLLALDAATVRANVEVARRCEADDAVERSTFGRLWGGAVHRRALASKSR